MPIRQAKQFGFDFTGRPELLASVLRSQKAILGLVQWSPGEDTSAFRERETLISMHWVLRLREDYAAYWQERCPQIKQRRLSSSGRSQRYLIIRHYGGLEDCVKMVLDKCCEWTATPKLCSGGTEATGHGASSSSAGKESWYLVRMPGP